MLVDMDGDGLTDYVWKNGNNIYVRYNTAGRAAGHQRPYLGGSYDDIYTDPVTGFEYPNYEINFEDHPNDILNQYDMRARSEALENYNCGL